MKPPKTLAPLLLLLASGCVHLEPGTASTTSIGPNEIPVKVVTGRSHGVYFLGFGPFYDGTLKAAVEDAKKKAPADSIVNVFVDRRTTCFPFPPPGCWVYEIETTVQGTLIKYREPVLRDAEFIQPPPSASQTQSAASASSAYDFLLTAYAKGQANAEEFLAGLTPAVWRDLRSFIITEKGNGSSWNWKLRVNASMSANEKACLEWYVGKYTDHKPLFEK